MLSFILAQDANMERLIKKAWLNGDVCMVEEPANVLDAPRRWW